MSIIFIICPFYSKNCSNNTFSLQRLCACSVTQWCPPLCDPMDCSSPGPSVHGIFQATILEWSEVKWKLFSSVQLFATPWTIQFMKFSRPEYWSGLAFPFSRGSSQPRDRTQVSHIGADSLPAEPQGKPKGWEAPPYTITSFPLWISAGMQCFSEWIPGTKEHV